MAKQSNAKTTLRHIFADRDCFTLSSSSSSQDTSNIGLFGSPRTPSTSGDTSSGNVMVRSEERARAQFAALRDRIMHNAEMKCIGGTDSRKVLSIVTLYRKYTRTLTFQNML